MMLCKGRLKTEVSGFQTAFFYGSRLMQMLVNGFRQCFADAFDLFQILFAGGNDAAQAAEAGE